MRVIVTGATGNVGTAVVRALAAESAVSEIVGLARRAPLRPMGLSEFVVADVAESDLAPIFRGADAVVHLAWLIQPGRDESVTGRVNLTGSRRVFAAAVEAKVPSLVYASSVGAYSHGPKDRLVDESWPTAGIPSSFYSRQKAAVERDLDRLVNEQPQMRVVRLRPGLIFQRSAATEVRRLFAGPLLPTSLLHARLAPFSPDVDGLRFQAVHADDVGDAYCRAALSDLSGPFNIAADPVIGSVELAQLLQARPVKIPLSLLRGAAAATFAMRLQPAEPGWVDMALGVPLMSTERARRELGWTPYHSSIDALGELVAGMRNGADDQTAPLARATSGPARVREFFSGLGKRQ
ncbi:MAG: NAD-dependent epimerase/dehydratase family protein [Solirubrobacteraceae bacterium]